MLDQLHTDILFLIVKECSCPTLVSLDQVSRRFHLLVTKRREELWKGYQMKSPMQGLLGCIVYRNTGLMIKRDDVYHLRKSTSLFKSTFNYLYDAISESACAILGWILSHKYGYYQLRSISNNVLKRQPTKEVLRVLCYHKDISTSIWNELIQEATFTNWKENYFQLVCNMSSVSPMTPHMLVGNLQWILRRDPELVTMVVSPTIDTLHGYIESLPNKQQRNIRKKIRKRIRLGLDGKIITNELQTLIIRLTAC